MRRVSPLSYFSVRSERTSQIQSGGNFEVRFVRGLRHQFAAPARDVGYRDVRTEVQFGFIHENPSARTAEAELECVRRYRPQGARG